MTALMQVQYLKPAVVREEGELMLPHGGNKRTIANDDPFPTPAR